MITHRVLVFGGREYNEQQFLFNSLDRLYAKLGTFIIIQGGAAGADTLAKTWGLKEGLPVVTMHAAWDFYKKPAGVIRNEWMLKYLVPTYAVQFPGGRGTHDMRTRCDSVGVPVWEPCVQSNPS
jgi:hypothetical protein